MKNNIIKFFFIPVLICNLFSKSTTFVITNRGKQIGYQFGTYEFKQQICLSDEKRKLIKQKLNQNILKLNINYKISRSNEHILFSWPLSLNGELGDYGYHGISGFVDNNLIFNNNLLDYNCGFRTYDTDDYNHQGIDYYLWPFTWNKVENNSVSVIAASSGIIIGKSDGNYDKNCGGWNTDYNAEWNAVYILNEDGSISWYGHLKNGSLTNKSIGDSINVGEYLGIVASSGTSTQPHLHFETYKDSTYMNLIDPYSGSCNIHNNDSWWIEQRPYYDSGINKIMTHSSPPEFFWDDCAIPANINEKNHFKPDHRIYFAAYFRDLMIGQISKWILINPKGDIYDEWQMPTIENHYSSAYYWYYYDFHSNIEKGRWLFKINYNEKQYEHIFFICDNDDLINYACDCSGNILDECGICGGSGIEEGKCDCSGNILDECGICGGSGSEEGFDCDGNQLSLYNGLIPEEFSIHSIYPNPFNPVTSITYGLPEHINVKIVVHNLSGKQVETLINEFQSPGFHSVNWEAGSLPSGVYLVRMESGDFTQIQKVALVK